MLNFYIHGQRSPIDQGKWPNDSLGFIIRASGSSTVLDAQLSGVSGPTRARSSFGKSQRLKHTVLDAQLPGASGSTRARSSADKSQWLKHTVLHAQSPGASRSTQARSPAVERSSTEKDGASTSS